MTQSFQQQEVERAKLTDAIDKIDEVRQCIQVIKNPEHREQLLKLVNDLKEQVGNHIYRR